MADFVAVYAPTIGWCAVFCIVQLQADSNTLGRENAINGGMAEEFASGNSEVAIVLASCLLAEVPVVVAGEQSKGVHKRCRTITAVAIEISFGPKNAFRFVRAGHAIVERTNLGAYRSTIVVFGK